MRKQYVRAWVFAVLAVSASVGAEADCVDPATLVRSTVSIVRTFEDREDANAGVTGIAGTAWFLTPSSVVTAGHVAQSMRLSEHDWTSVAFHERDSETSFLVRVAHLVGSGDEKVAILELQTSYPHAAVLRVRAAPLVADEPVLSLAYPDLELRYASGRFMRFGSDATLAGTALLEMYDGSDRFVLDHGASGAPVLDCDGRVVAVITNVLSRTIDVLSQTIRVSTAWQTPNVVAMPLAPLGKLIPSR
jgi:Trypsin-like peptidase domain